MNVPSVAKRMGISACRLPLPAARQAEHAICY